MVMKQTEVKNKLKRLMPVLSDRFSVKRIGYFGSYSRDEQTDKSDIDIIVEFSKPVGWEFFDLQEFLEHELNIKVDLVSSRALKEQLRDSILKQVQYV
jgi:predicted nucleotidyltransferase